MTDLNELIGKRYGKLTIISAERKKCNNDKHNYIYVLAECDCGNITECRFASVQNGTTTSCGCAQREKVTKIDLNKLIGEKHSFLTITEAHRRADGQIIVKAKCECGSEKEYMYTSIQRGSTKSCGCGLLAHKVVPPKIDLNSLIGQKFHMLTVIDAWRNERSEIMAKVQCECGNIKECRYRNLTLGQTKSCGCAGKIDLASLIGQKFGKLVILSAYREKGKIYVKAQCECGNIKECRLTLLKNHHVTSCGCNKRRANGESANRLYGIWYRMINRCYNEKDARYNDWGGRGIRVCDEWKNSYDIFKTWANANGYADTLSIDRIDNDKNYCPENCHWVTTKEQNRNKRNSFRIIFHGEDVSLKTLCEDLDINYNQIKDKYKKGIDVLPILEEKYHLLREVK